MGYTLAGIDGCKAGWLAILFDGETYHFSVLSQLEELLDSNCQLQRVLIDMPIGLSSENFPRSIDTTLRQQLPGRGSTVFNVPCRKAVYANTHEEARQLNIAIEGKSLSAQTLNICPKIKEMDLFVSGSIPFQMYESHPEHCFKHLNKGIVLQSKKSTSQGISERLQLIESYDQQLSDLYHHILKNTKRKDVRPDDIVDAICLCLVNKLALTDALSFIADHNHCDERGLAFNVAYYNPASLKKRNNSI